MGGARNTLALGAKFKGKPKCSVIKINNILVQYFKKSKFMQKLMIKNKILNKEQCHADLHWGLGKKFQCF